MRNERPGLSSTSLIRSYNVVSVLQALYREGACSRTRLAKLTKMSPATITRIVGELLAQGIITEHGVGESIGGRKPILLELNYEKLFIVGIQIRRDQIALGLADLKGKLMRKTSYSLFAGTRHLNPRVGPGIPKPPAKHRRQEGTSARRRGGHLRHRRKRTRHLITIGEPWVARCAHRRHA